jgi:hypothetical protein
VAKRNDIAPYERPEARKWTRVTDYVPDADSHVRNVHWPKPGSLPALPDRDLAEARRRSRRGLWLPIAAVALAAGLGLWGSGTLEPTASTRTAAAASTTSRGLRFGLCDQGGLTNCVASGDSFYLGGKTIRIASIEAPQLYGAACPREAQLGRLSAKRLQALLNSGELEMTRAGDDLERYGLMVRNVAVDGKDVGRAMIEAGVAREIGDLTRSWC